jgi:DNA-binding beta-propeller fold protein YncE
MNRSRLAFVMAILLCATTAASAQDAPPLRLIGTIPLRNVKGRIDHMAVDVKGQRLFVAALGNNTLEVIDLRAAKLIRSITGLSEPQGVAYVPDLNRILVANGGDGTCRLFDGDSFRPVSTINLGEDADNVRYYPGLKPIYVGYGRGGLSMIDPSNGRVIGEVKLPAHPEAFEVEKSGSNIYVNVPGAKEIAVIDRDKQSVVSKWSDVNFHSNFPMALDESHHRLFIGTWQPARLVVLDTKSGNIVADLKCSQDADDLFYDPKSRRIYVSCGEGFIDVFEQQDADHYREIARINSEAGARTSLLVPELNSLFVAVPHGDNRSASIIVYETQQKKGLLMLDAPKHEEVGEDASHRRD